MQIGAWTTTKLDACCKSTLTETIAILAIVLMFAILGFVQEYRAERAMAAVLRANPAMVGLAVLTIVLQLAAVYLPFLDEFLKWCRSLRQISPSVSRWGWWSGAR